MNKKIMIVVIVLAILAGIVIATFTIKNQEKQLEPEISESVNEIIEDTGEIFIDDIEE